VLPVANNGFNINPDQDPDEQHCKQQFRYLNIKSIYKKTWVGTHLRFKLCIIIATVYQATYKEMWIRTRFRDKFCAAIIKKTEIIKKKSKRTLISN
jgi:hypothetical protein